MQPVTSETRSRSGFGLLPLLVVVALVASLLGGFAVSPAEANHSHFRYGNISWQPTGDGEVLFEFTAAFRRSGYSGTYTDGRPAVGDIITETVGGTDFDFGDGTRTGTLRYQVTSIDPQNDWLVGVALDPGTDNLGLRHTYEEPGTYTAFSETCCRFTHVNNSNGSYRLETTVTAGGTERSPVSTLPPIVSCLEDSVCEFPVPAAHADSDNVTFHLATASESRLNNQPGPPHAEHEATLDPETGMYRWDTTGATIATSGPTYYSTHVVVTDDLGHKIPVDFLIEIVDSEGNPPVFQDPSAPENVPECGSTIPARLGQLVTFAAWASDPDGGDVTLNIAGLPSGAFMSPSLPLTASSVAQSDFFWTPSSGQTGSYVLTIIATDADGRSAFCPVTIDVGASAALGNVVVMGDSYSSGEGTRNYDLDSGRCHRSPDAWGEHLSTFAMGTNLVANLACSGARIENVVDTSQHGFDSQFIQLLEVKNELASQGRSIDTIMFTLGGNDLGFERIMSKCFQSRFDARGRRVPNPRACVNDPVLRDPGQHVDRVLNQLRDEVIPLLRGAVPDADLVLIGYPRLFPERHEDVATCGWLTDEERWRINGATSVLTVRSYDFVEETDIYFVNSLNAMAGHELCTPDTWFHPILALRSAPDRQQFAHPESIGQFRWAEWIIEDLRRQGLAP